MRNKMTVFVIGCLAFSSLKAQELPTQKIDRFKVGVFAGLTHAYSLVIKRSPTEFMAENNLLAGIDLQYQLTSRSSMHLQPAWTQVTDVKSQNSFVASTFSLTTLKLPILYRYYLSPNRKLFFVQTGVSYNYLASSTYREQLDIVCITAPCPVILNPNSPASNKSAISGIAGLGVTIDGQKISVPITLQYERYFSNYLFPNQYDGQPARVKFESFSLTTGITF